MYLEEPVHFSSGINILCGKNGSGKTRLIEAIKTPNITSVSNEQGDINLKSILFITSKDMLKINSGQIVSQQGLDDIYRAICRSYQQYLTEKSKNPNIKLDREVHQDSRGSGYHLNAQSFGDFIRKVAKNNNKDIDDLSESEIKSEQISSRIQLNVQNEMSSICASYLWLKRQNSYSSYLKDNGEEDAYVYDFDKKHGRPPWIIINEILRDELEVDWYLEQTEKLSEDIKPVLFKKYSDGTAINIQTLSDGEKTILWIACALIKHTLSRRSLEECKLILLDEPDAFLHPKMIHSFISVIRRMSEELRCDVLMSTHSPTTVALATDCHVYNVTPHKITPVSKDRAIRDLLEGVNYIAVSPENRRTVYVEGYVDRVIYEMIFMCLTENCLTPAELTLQFIEAAPRTDKNYLLNKIKQHWKSATELEADMLAAEINGQGSCSSVRGQVSAFRATDDSSVYGIIDRDKNNRSKNGLVVLCGGDFYALDNVILNPVSIALFLYQEYSQEAIFNSVFGSLNYTLLDLVQSQEKLSEAVNTLCYHVFPQDNLEFKTISYINGFSYPVSTKWIDDNGHKLEDLIKEKFSFLDCHKFKKEGKLKEHVSKLMCDIYKAKYYPLSLLQTFEQIR